MRHSKRMLRSPSAVSFARALLTLQRAAQTGVLEVLGQGERVRVAVVDGIPRAVTPLRSADLSLGDALLRAGDLDADRHRSAMHEQAPSGPVGDWLVACGAASRPAVALALRHQFRVRMLGLFGLRDARYRFIEGGAELVEVPWLPEPPCTGDLVMTAMRHTFADVPLWQALKPIGEGPLSLTRLGERVVTDAALWPEEAAMVTLLRRGTSLAVLRAAVKGSPRALRTLAALHALSAVAGRNARDASYSLLVKKRRQLRADEGPHALLEIPIGARPMQARRALRRLARQLHPDCLGPDAPAALRVASDEVMRALIHAESQVRASTP